MQNHEHEGAGARSAGPAVQAVEASTAVDRRTVEIMLDLETLGTKPDAAIISFAAVAFDLGTGAEVSSIRRNITWSSAMDVGTVDGDTLEWWNRPEHEAARRRLYTPEPIVIEPAMRDLVNWWTQDLRSPVGRVWCYGRFDDRILEHSIRQCRVSPAGGMLFTYRDVMDLRSVANWEELCDGPRPFRYARVCHDPLEDCRAQIETISALFDGRCGSKELPS